MSTATIAPLLHPLRFPLHGSRLVEASAGTGKTFTIAALYVRLILGHGGDAAFARPLTPPEILVVTFTEAATKELRDRIRARLSEAADAFLADPQAVEEREAGEDLLHDLRADHPPAQWPACARALRLAAEWMDESAVSTIHGWCNRMLSEHAFDSGSLFTQTLETDQRELQAEAARDYWRTWFTPLDVGLAQAVSEWWARPDALWEGVKKLLPLTASLSAGASPAAAVQQAQTARAQALQALKTPWGGEKGWVAELRSKLDAATKAKQCKLPARNAWMTTLQEWATGDANLPDFTPTAWKRLDPDDLRAGWSGDDSLLSHPAWAALTALRPAVAALPTGREDLLCHATHWIAQRMATEQMRRAQMGFDELLTRLDAGLSGPNGTRLAALIRAQFPVALIDEFQDTDPVQYRIFDTIYGVADSDPATALVLIGDPKQAIYAFRGADIHTYLRARGDTHGRHATLGTNFRSTQAMVDAVNHVFDGAEVHEQGQGAFLFRSAAGNRLPFARMAARGRDDVWQVDGTPAPALTFWQWDTPTADDNGGDITKTQAVAMAAAACATQIVSLLNDGQAGRCGFAGLKGALRAVRPGDMAVLVNSGREAAAVREQLDLRGVRSVYLSDRSSVFASAVAGDLQRLLAACAEPDNARALHAALGSQILGLSWSQLDRLEQDELHWEARLLQFRDLHQVWMCHGVLPMLRRLLNEFGVPQRLRARGDERGLTDLLHLAELLQHASARLDGQHALIRWLAAQRQDSGQDNDERKLRLESDAELVKVVTIHKSKGLEYPLVFLPFATAFRATKPQDVPLKWTDDAGQTQVALQATAHAVALADRERLGEDLRKLYVALTRARYATWIAAAPLPQVERSALGSLLDGGQPLSAAELQARLHALAEGCDAIAVEPLPEPVTTCFTPRRASLVDKPALALPAGERDRWWITSYSGLNRTSASVPLAAADANDPTDGAIAPQAPQSASQDIYAESQRDASDESEARGAPPATAGGAGLHGFPRGAAPGHFLHGLLEWAGQQGFARVRTDPGAQADLSDLVARRCSLRGWESWIEPLRTWLNEWLDTPLRLDALARNGSPTLAIAPKELKQYQVEMEFWFAVSGADTVTLDALVQRHTLQGVARTPLQPQQVNGLLKGFIDLVFEHDGRYYVADYKSNHLGASDADYTAAAMREAIVKDRYDLQFVLYVYALHRLLRSRIPDYAYERHVGGAVYLFIRGHGAATQGLHCERPPLALIEAMDQLFGDKTSTPAALEAMA